MTIYTIGFTKKSAHDFFELIKANQITLLLDIRLNNSSQLAGFSKGSDLNYFLSEICKCGYQYEAIFAPTKELMEDFKSKNITAEQFEINYTQLMTARSTLPYYIQHYATAGSVCLLCSEEFPDSCHRRVLAELLIKEMPGTVLKHL